MAPDAAASAAGRERPGPARITARAGIARERVPATGRPRRKRRNRRMDVVSDALSPHPPEDEPPGEARLALDAERAAVGGACKAAPPSRLMA